MLRPAATILLLLAGALPALAQPQALPAEQLKKIKAATVFVKVSHGPFGGTGSGFVVHAAKDFGLIVTNEHVVEPGERIRAQLLPGSKANVEVVFNSGQGAAEWSAKAEVLHVNKEDDLALLKVKALKPMPEALSLTGADKLPETTPVYVCGFPFGEDLAEGNKNPEISIGVASVSSNRTDAAGEVTTVQLNGALNPGNSGGPVVTQDGKLVGVAVRTLTGAGIGFAVPPAKVRRAVGDIHFAPPVATWPEGTRTLRLAVRVVDAYGAFQNPTASIAPAPNAWNAPNSADLAKQPGAKAVPVTRTGEMLALEFPVPESAHVWLQFAWKDKDGTARRSVPVRVATTEVLAKYPLPLRPAPRYVPVIPVKPQIDPLPPRETPKPAPTPAPTRPSRLPPKTGPADGFLTMADGERIRIADLATKIEAKTPDRQIDVDELNRTARTRTGERVTVDILTTGAGVGYGDGPSLAGFNRVRATPGGLDFVVDAGMAAILDRSKLGGATIAVRMNATIRRAKTPQWELVVVEEIALLGANGTIVAVVKRSDAAPADQPMPPQTPAKTTRMQPEPFPLGDVLAQDRSHIEIRTFSPDLVGRRYHWSVIISGVSDENYQTEGKTYRYSRLHLKQPLSRVMLGDVAVYTTTEASEEIRVAMSKLRQGAGMQFYCLVEFEITKSGFGKMVAVARSVQFRNPTDPKQPPTTLRPDPPEMFDPDKAVPNAKRPAPKPVAPAIEPADDGGHPIALIAVTGAVGLLVLGGIAWTILRSRTPAKSQRSVRNRHDQGDNDRPSRRPRRDRAE